MAQQWLEFDKGRLGLSLGLQRHPNALIPQLFISNLLLLQLLSQSLGVQAICSSPLEGVVLFSPLDLNLLGQRTYHPVHGARAIDHALSHLHFPTPFVLASLPYCQLILSSSQRQEIPLTSHLLSVLTPLGAQVRRFVPTHSSQTAPIQLRPLEVNSPSGLMEVDIWHLSEDLVISRQIELLNSPSLGE
ncbi:uncharacterized protein A4U43_C01F14410 [Asparagus officinalis]|uniref:Uncharacterized protein n=1 Tax=Asparagus officinalis TaxID=4686 RepID=A0A5P1FPI8_ASPOF|nr:uncharacterized protein A4U43_C01F14410 [Asparagus officinalis]